MEAIITLPKKSKSSFTKHNFKTFQVVNVLNTIVTLNIGGATVDFSHDEVVISRIVEEIESMEKRKRELSEQEEKMLQNLYWYCRHKNIQLY